LVLLLAALVRFLTLTRQSVWLDESFSYWIAQQPPLQLVGWLWRHDTHGPLYYLLLQPMIALGGDEWLLRLPSALAGLASVGFLYALGAELFDRPTALLSALLLALSPLHIWYAQEARMYALVATLALAASLFLVRALRRNRPADWVALGFFEGAALLTDTAAIWFTFAINAAALLAVLWLWRERRFWPWVGAQLLAILIYSPWLLSFWRRVEGGSAGWIPPATLLVLGRTVADFAGSFMRPTAEAVAVLILFAVGFALAARPLWREARARPIDYLLLGCWLLVPLGLAFGLSQPYLRPDFVTHIFGAERSVFLTRNLIIASLPVYLLFARALRLVSPRARLGVLLALLLLNGLAYLGTALSPYKEDMRAAAALIGGQAQENDLVVFSPHFLELPFGYYYDHGREPAPFDSFLDGYIARSGNSYPSEREALPDFQRVWLITSDNIYYRDERNAAQFVAERGQLVEQWRLYGVGVALYHLP
jgi:uncharacterized membrane protein